MAGKLGLRKCAEKENKTANNKEYKIARKLQGVQCIICMGRCGWPPAYQRKRCGGRKPRYKDKRKSWGRNK